MYGSDVRDGGHSPVLAELRLAVPPILSWTSPRPRLPDLLRKSSRELRGSTDWKDLVEAWSASPEVRQLDCRLGSVHALSAQLETAMQKLVKMAGGWSLPSPTRHKAYDSGETRRVRACIRGLHECVNLLRREQGVGTSSRRLTAALSRLQKLGLPPPPESRLDTLQWAILQLPEHHRMLRGVILELRKERQRRWRGRIPTLWQENPKAVYRWLAAVPLAWGTVPILTASGVQCTTTPEVEWCAGSGWTGSGACMRRWTGR